MKKHLYIIFYSIWVFPQELIFKLIICNISNFSEKMLHIEISKLATQTIFLGKKITKF